MYINEQVCQYTVPRGRYRGHPLIRVGHRLLLPQKEPDPTGEHPLRPIGVRVPRRPLLHFPLPPKKFLIFLGCVKIKKSFKFSMMIEVVYLPKIF